jgi:hypothetical protein
MFRLENRDRLTKALVESLGFGRFREPTDDEMVRSILDRMFESCLPELNDRQKTMVADLVEGGMASDAAEKFARNH